jgi:hypothetical protein
MENFAERLEKLEKDVENVKTQIRKKAEKQKLTLQEKFDIHDRAKNLVAEFESMQVDTWTVTKYHIDELKTIIKCFAELIDHALGVEFP